MSDSNTGQFVQYFGVIYDPRQPGKVIHKLIDILFIAVCATICGCDDWDDMQFWAEEREEWLRQYISLENGIPTSWTIARVFDVIDPKQFALCFTEWMRELTQIQPGAIVPIDGKTMRGTANPSQGKKALHIVNAWCSQNKLLLGQTKTDEKSNEITAIPELLDMLFLKGAVVTIDAMGCQRKIVEKIVKDKKADYVLGVKGNQPTLLDDIKLYFEEEAKSNFKDPAISSVTTLEKGHGRIEKREYYLSTDIDWMATKDDWTKLQGIGMVIRHCQQGEKHTEERTFHICSVTDASVFADAVREHWGVESAHWSLDVTFREDACKVSKGKAAENLAMLKRLAMNMVKKDTTRYPKRSLKKRRFTACLSLDYLHYLLTINFQQ